MKKATKILLTVLSAASLFGVAACNNTEKTNTPEVEVVKPVAEFKGSATISEVQYNVVLALYEDKTLVLKPGNGADEKTGSYVFTEGEGYTLTIAGAEFKTKWNAEAKAHEFTYELKLGDAGKGNVVLSLADADFVLTAKAPRVEFIEGATFDGVLNFFGNHNLHLRFNEDGTYNITTDTEMAMVKGMLEKTGAYTFANNVFTITLDDVQYKSVFNPATATYALTYTVKGQDGTVPVTLYYQKSFVLSGTADDFGGLTFDMTVNSDGTCFADITTTMPSMNAMFDKEGTWTMSEGNFVFSFKQSDETVKTFTSKIDAATGLLTCDYEIMGERLVKTVLSGSPVVLTGEVSNLGGIVFDLKFVSETECFVDVTSKAATSMNAMFDKKGTYTVENGQISIVVGEKTYTSTFNEENGTYTLVYELVGTDATLYPELTYSVWE